MITEGELIAESGRIEIRVLHEWIEMGLVVPHRGEGGYLFDDADIARVHLVCDLCYDMGLEHESLPVVLSLVDKLHRAHHSLRAFAAAVAEQPDEVRTTIALSVRRTLGSGEGQ